MKKILGVLVALAMCVCLCLPSFAADLSAITDSLGDLDLSGLDLSGISDVDLGSITDTVGGLLGGSTDDISSSVSDVTASLGEFDSTGALTDFTEGLDTSSLSALFSGLLGSFSDAGVDISEGGFSTDDLGIANIMDSFSGVLEMLGMDSETINGLLDNDIVNFFANLYLGMGGTDTPVEPEPEEPTTKEPVIDPPADVDTGVEDGIIVACATLSVAAAAAFVCTRKKRA